MPSASPPALGGRPSRYDAPTALALIAAVGRGLSLADAACSIGLSPSTAYAWQAAGRAGDPRFVPLVDALRAVGVTRLPRSLTRAFASRFLGRLLEPIP